MCACIHSDPCFSIGCIFLRFLRERVTLSYKSMNEKDAVLFAYEDRVLPPLNGNTEGGEGEMEREEEEGRRVGCWGGGSRCDGRAELTGQA